MAVPVVSVCFVFHERFVGMLEVNQLGKKAKVLSVM